MADQAPDFSTTDKHKLAVSTGNNDVTYDKARVNSISCVKKQEHFQNHLPPSHNNFDGHKK